MAGTVLSCGVVGMQGQDDIELVEAARSGDPVAFGRLFDRWFDRTYDVSWHIVRNPDTAAEIAQDSFLAAWEQLPTLRQPESFGGWVLRIARNRSLNRLERERRSVPSDDDTVMAVLDRRADQGDIAADLADQERDQLVWAAAAALGERDASLLDLHLRHDLSAAAIADELDTTTNNVHQLLHRLRGRLAGAIRSWVLWRDGRAQCLGLADAIDAARLTRFGPEAVRVISAHAADCDVCGETQRAVLAPEALFAAVPIVAAPVALKAQAAAGLMAAGVPLGSALSRLAPRSSGPTGSSGPSGSGTPGGPGDPGGAGGSASGGASGATSIGETTVVPTGGPVRSLRALRSSASGRRLLVAGAAAMALVIAGVTALVLSGDPAGDDDQAAVNHADAAVSEHDAVGDAAEGEPGTDDGSGVSPTSTPSTSVAGGPGNGGGAPGDDAGGGGGGSSDPGDPGGPGNPGEPGVPPGGGTTTTQPGGSTGSTTTSTTPPDPDVDPPVIAAFRATITGRCGDLPLMRTVVLVWASSGGDSARLGLLGVLGGDVPPSGSLTRCVLLGDIYLLTVLGPGGQDSAQVTIAL